MFKRRKDGSLNLSIQAIVILVMAMAVLGLGLAFIRTLFDQGTDKLVGQIDDINIMKATADTPLTTTNTVKVKQGQNAQLQASVYNADNTDPNANFRVRSLGCVYGGSETTVKGFALTCPAQLTVPLGKTTNFGCAVIANDPASISSTGYEFDDDSGKSSVGLWTCTIVVEPDAEIGTTFGGLDVDGNPTTNIDDTMAFGDQNYVEIPSATTLSGSYFVQVTI